LFVFSVALFSLVYLHSTAKALSEVMLQKIEKRTKKRLGTGLPSHLKLILMSNASRYPTLIPMLLKQSPWIDRQACSPSEFLL
jgi:hypothetical protein